MLPRISAAEWEVMNVVWDRHPITAPEVLAALPGKTVWKQKTVNTFLTRLVDKGVLRARREGRANLYRPRIPREDCVASESKGFLHRVFQGAAGSLVLHFFEDADLTPEQIAELERMLKEKKDER